MDSWSPWVTLNTNCPCSLIAQVTDMHNHVNAHKLALASFDLSIITVSPL